MRTGSKILSQRANYWWHVVCKFEPIGKRPSICITLQYAEGSLTEGVIGAGVVDVVDGVVGKVGGGSTFGHVAINFRNNC